MPPLRRLYGFTDVRLNRTLPLIVVLRDIGAAHEVTITQVALAWLITTYGDTVIAIPGASKPHHAEEAAGAMFVRLTDDEVGASTMSLAARRHLALTPSWSILAIPGNQSPKTRRIGRYSLGPRTKLTSQNTIHEN